MVRGCSLCHLYCLVCLDITDMSLKFDFCVSNNYLEMSRRKLQTNGIVQKMHASLHWFSLNIYKCSNDTHVFDVNYKLFQTWNLFDVFFSNLFLFASVVSVNCGRFYVSGIVQWRTLMQIAPIMWKPIISMLLWKWLCSQ